MNFQAPALQTIQLLENRQVDVLRIDAIDPLISGNKWFKLKYNIAKAKELNAGGIVTFGGQHSNHLVAAAEACRREKINMIAIVRAEDSQTENETLKFIESTGAHINFVSRAIYKQKHLPENLKVWSEEYANYFFIPEGGANEYGRKGSEEIARYLQNYDYVFCACGTGTMYAGLIKGLKPTTIVGGINVLKGKNELVHDVNTILPDDLQIKGNEVLLDETIVHSFITDAFAFKGYACYEPELVRTVHRVKSKLHLQLDHIYTSKLFYAVEKMLVEDRLPQTAKIALVHSGGLQGNAAFERRYGL